MKTWIRDFPKEAGCYWYYGDPFTSEWHINDYKYELHLVWVKKISGGLIYIADGHFFENKINYGYWQKLELPELPKDI